MPPTDETDRTPEGLRTLLADLTGIGGGSKSHAEVPHLEALGLVEHNGRDSSLTPAGRALKDILNEANMIAEAKRGIAFAGYAYSVEMAWGGSCPWQVTLCHLQWPAVEPLCKPRETLAFAMWEAMEVALSRKL